jgi:hypothetical protein
MFSYYFNLACPKVRRKTAISSNVPWINNDITAGTKLKSLYYLYMQSMIQEHRNKYKAYKKEYSAVIKTVKEHYIQQIITSSNNTPKELWKLANRETGSLNNTLTCNIHLQVENETVSSPSKICRILNVTILDTVNKLLLDKNLMHSQASSNTISQKDSLALLEIKETELTKVIKSLKNKKISRT